jgi:hypothetical protein
MDLPEMLALLRDAIRHVDSSGVAHTSSKPPFRAYQPGAGPYSETVLCKRIAEWLSAHSADCKGACTRRFPDLLIPDHWAIELKIARPFGDNGKEAEHWSQNLLHPYPGNTSSLSDALKLMKYEGPERCAVVVVGYEHATPQISLDPLIRSFEAIAQHVFTLELGTQHQLTLSPLVHPVHQVARLWGWEIRRR